MIEHGSLGVAVGAGGVAAVTVAALAVLAGGNRRPAEGSGGPGERGVSEVVGVVLLFGIVLAGAAIVIVAGTQVTDDVREDGRMESAELSMQEFDARMESLSGGGGSATFEATDTGGRDASVVTVNESASRVTFSLNGTASCSASVELGTVRYVDDSGRWVAYEGGGVWRGDGEEGRATMVSPPNLRYVNGTIDFVADNVTGQADTNGEITVQRNDSESGDRTEQFMRSFLTHDGTGEPCMPRESVHVTIRSPHYRAWADYLRAEFPDTTAIAVDDATNTVRMVLDDELRPFDSDGDGTPDAADNCPTEYNPDQSDVDGDGDGDVCDPDDDGDDYPDRGYYDDNPVAPGDGLEDTEDNCQKEPNPSQDDQDGDGLGDACDPDVDGDGYRNAVPAPYVGEYDNSTFPGGSTPDNCPTAYNPDQRDTDGNGDGDACDPDDDGDGLEDYYEGGPDNCPRVSAGDTTDNDAGNRGDPCDPDDDGDDYYDSVASDYESPDGTTGINESRFAGEDNCPRVPNPSQADGDGDGVGDVCDPDLDDDGVDNPEDNCPTTPNADQENTDAENGGSEDANPRGDACDPDDDGDGVPDDGDNCQEIYNPDQADSDGDGVGDACEDDIDGDGIGNDEDNCPGVANPDQRNTDASEGGSEDANPRGDACDPDDDGDQVPDGTDNCPRTYNPAQTDSDGDGNGDACEDDADGDGVPNDADNCPTTPNADQRNTDASEGGSEDANPRGDACDPDDDGDGVPDGTDNCPRTYNPGQADGDGDGQGAACDPDDTGGETGGVGGSPPGVDGDFLDVTAVDPSGYREVAITAEVDTAEGEAGALDEDDFQVFEDGVGRPVVEVTFAEETRVDVVFVFDVTGSMSNEITEMQANTRDFADGLEAAGVDARYGLVTFRDGNGVRQSMTADVDAFKDAVDTMSASGGDDAPEDSFDAIDTGLDLSFRDDAETVVVHVTDAPSHDEDRSSTSVSALRSEMQSRDVTFYTVSPPEGVGPGVGGCTDTAGGSWGYLDLASDTGGEHLNICTVDGFEPFLDDIEDDLTSRYRVVFRTCRPGDGTGRGVDLYANSEGRTARDDTGYTAPDDGTPESCYEPPEPDPAPDDDVEFGPPAPDPAPDEGISYGPPTPDPDPDASLPALPSGGTPSDTDRARYSPPNCDAGDTPDPGSAPGDPGSVADDDGDGTAGCYPVATPAWSTPTPPEPYTTLVHVRVNYVEVED